MVRGPPEPALERARNAEGDGGGIKALAQPNLFDALERRVKAAGFEETTTIEDFDFSFNPKVPAAQIRDLATLRFLDAGESVILHGLLGVGKSMIAQALGHAACRRGHSEVFTKTSRLLADLADGHADRSWEAWLRRCARLCVLIF